MKTSAVFAVASTAAAALAATACASLLGLHDVHDDSLSGDDGPFVDDDGAAAAPDGGAPEASTACDASVLEDPNNCGACGHVCGVTNATVACIGGACVFTCAQGYVHCGSDDSTGCSTATAVDSHHCGACDHDCLGAMCTKGLCAPVPLAVSRNASVMVAVDGQNVYWTDEGSTAVTMPSMGDGAVLRANKVDGGAPTVIAANQAGARGIFVDDNQVYWTNLTGGQVSTVAKSGGAATPVATGQDYPWFVVADAVNYYWAVGANDVTVQPAGSIWMMPRSGGPAVRVAAAQYSPIMLAVEQGFIYWAQDTVLPNGALMRAPIDGGPATTLAPAANAVSVAASDGGVFWANSSPFDAGSIVRVPLDGGAPVTLLSSLFNPGWLALDDAHVYWTDPTAGAIWRAGLDGTEPLMLAAGRNRPIGIAVDDAYVYWAEVGTVNAMTGWYDNHDGVVAKVAK